MIKIITQALLISFFGISMYLNGAFADYPVDKGEHEMAPAQFHQNLNQPISQHSHNPCINSSPAYYPARESRNIEISERKPWMGYGACGVYGCPCQGFVESYGSDLCGNCGHRYTDHW